MGLDLNGALEISYCFPSLKVNEVETNTEGGVDGYAVSTAEDSSETCHRTMMQNLRDVNVDWSEAGWYTSRYLFVLQGPLFASDAINHHQCWRIFPFHGND